MKRSILHLIRTLDPERGGPVEFVRRMAVVHAQAGVQVKILTLDRNDPGWVRDLPASVIECGPGRGLYGFNPRLEATVTAAARSSTVMVVHGLWQFHGLCASNVSRKVGVPYFVFPHGMLDPWFRKSDLRKHLKKQAYWLLAERRVLRDATEVLFTSDHEARSAAATFCPAANYRSRVVPLGVSRAPTDIEPLRARFFKVFPHLRGRRFLLFLGRLHPKKGCDLLVRAMADLRPPLDLVLAGPSSDPAHDERLRRAAAGLPITFTGMIQGDLKAGALASAEALILPSHQENFGLAVAEALSFGTPALVSTQVNIKESIRLFGAGFVEPDTLIGTRRLIERWLQTGGAAMRTAALRCFQQRFDIENSAAELLEVLTGHA